MCNRITRYALILGLAAIGTGCRDGTGVGPSLRAAAGLYVLAAVNGQPVPTNDPSAPVGGSLYLWPTGHAERHVTYRAYDGATQDVESVGTFRFENNAIVLELQPKGEYALPAWSVYGSLDGATLTLGYPGPADGWMKEEYRRR